MRRLLTSLSLSLLVLVALAPSASAWERAGRAWPGERITYYTSASGYRSAVDRAVRIWNRANTGIRFARTSRRRAQVVIGYGGRRCEGAAYAGYVGRGHQSPVRLGRGCSRGLITLTAVHELGHVMGLGHEDDRCARMNSAFDGTGTPWRCDRRSLSYWLDRPLARDDIRGARALYR